MFSNKELDRTHLGLFPLVKWSAGRILPSTLLCFLLSPVLFRLREKKTKKRDFLTSAQRYSSFCGFSLLFILINPLISFSLILSPSKKRPGCKHTIQWLRETPERKEVTVVFYLTARNSSFSLGASCSAKQSTETATTLSVPALNLELQMPAQCWPCLTSPWIFPVFLTEDPRRLDHLYSEFVRSRRRNELLSAKWMVLWFSVLQPNPPRHSSKLENMSTDCFLPIP